MSVDQVLDLLRCPLCRAALSRAERSVGCPSGHRFDLARQGYLNLAGRAAPAHADTTEMVAARARFLGTGGYDPVSDVVREVVLATLPEGPAPRMVEVGAGTGHYLAQLLDGVGGRGVALDISPAAARRAAQAHARLGAVVADVWAALPLTDAAFEVVLGVFAPRNPPEFARVLAPGGVAVVVTPDPDHLRELRAPLGLLDIEAGKSERLTATMAEHLEPGERRSVRYPLVLDAAALVNLVAMGPNAFHRGRETVTTQVQELRLPLTVTVAVSISGWTRR